MSYAHENSRRAAEWRRDNAVRARAITRRLRDRQRAIVVQHYGAYCACCGEDEYAFLAIDHVDGGGAQDRKKRGGPDWVGSLIRDGFPPGYQVLCHNCNAAKERPGGCPHQSSQRLRTVDIVMADAALRQASTRKRLTCKRGHPMTEENTGRSDDGRRFCRICKRSASRKRRSRKAVHKPDRTVCKHGHALTGANIYIEPKRGYIKCRRCAADRYAAYKARQATDDT